MTVSRTRAVPIAVGLLMCVGAPPVSGASAASRPAVHAPASPVTRHDLQSVLVPALQGNPAGRLHRGVLPHPSPGGYTGLVTDSGARPAFGDLTGDGVQDAAAEIASTSENRASQDIELYTDGNHRRLGQFDLLTVMPAVAHVSYSTVLAMKIRRQIVLLDFELFAHGTRTPKFWSARLRWNGHRVVAHVSRGTGSTNSGLWSDPKLTLAGNHLGGVRVGSTNAAAETAAGVQLETHLGAEGQLYSGAELPGGPRTYFGIDGRGRVRCVGVAAVSGSTQTIVTPAGIRLGDRLREVRRVYGSRAHWSAPAHDAPTKNYGWVVHTRRGTLTFFTTSGRVITAMAAGGRGTGPNSCVGCPRARLHEREEAGVRSDAG